MSTILETIFSVSFGYSILRVTTPILFAAMAALISDRAGVINISLEGIMLTSALAGVLASAYSQSVILGILGAVLTGMALSFILAYFSLSLKTDIILAGIALNLLASGGTVFVLYLFTHEKGMSIALSSLVVPNLSIPLLKDIPVLGPILSNHNILTYVALLSVLVLYLILYKTPLGLRIRAVGENPNAVSSVGVSVIKMQYLAIVLSGVFASLGGAFMSMGYVSCFTRDMTAGRGFIALAAEAMGRGTPAGTLLATFMFGFADALSNSLQALRIPAQFVQILPYAMTIVGLIIYSVRQSGRLKRKFEK